MNRWWWGALLSIVPTGIIQTVWRFQNPEMTETQTFLEWWPLTLAAAAVAAICVFLANRKDDA